VDGGADFKLTFILAASGVLVDVVGVFALTTRVLAFVLAATRRISNEIDTWRKMVEYTIAFSGWLSGGQRSRFIDKLGLVIKGKCRAGSYRGTRSGAAVVLVHK